MASLLVAVGLTFLVADGLLPLATDRSEMPELEAVAVVCLILAAGLAVAVGIGDQRSGLTIGPWLVLAAFLAFTAMHMGTELDHVIRSAGVHWQVVYAPLVVVGAAALAIVARRLLSRHRRAAAVLAGGALMWASAAAVWSLGWPRVGGPLTFAAVRAPERALEAAGSVLLALALLWVICSAPSRSDEKEIAAEIRSTRGGTNVR